MPIPVAIDIPIVEEISIDIDGVADEAPWSEAREIKGFITFRPKPGNEPKQQTSVRAMASKDALYLHFTAHDDSPESVYRGFGRRDSRKGDDYIGVLIDVLGSGERGAIFIANPLGVQLDGTLVRGRDTDLVPWGGSWSSWDTLWTSAGRVTENGYEVEMSIPWSSVRHPVDMDTIGLTLFRKVSRTAEMSSWPTLDPNIEGTLNQSAKVTGPGELQRSLGLSVLPEMTATRTNEGFPDDRPGYAGIAPGVTFQAAPSPALQLLATLNPDFSQVESDEAKIDVNQRYSLQYQEKRPFFLEGQEWFSHPIEDLIYTRSMVSPLYGARATSETGPVASSILYVHDQTPAPSVSENKGWTEDDLEGRTTDSTVGRLRWSVGSDHMIGAIVSNRTVRSSALHHNLMGLDARIKLGQKLTLQAAALGSNTTGIDQDDGIAPAGILRSRIRGRHIQSRVEATYLSKNFRTENGFQPVADAIRVENRTELVTYPKWSLIPRLLFSPADGELTFRESGEMRDYTYRPSIGSWFSNGTYFVFKGGPKGEEYEDVWLEYVDAALMGGGSWTRWLRARMRIEAGGAPYYDTDDPFVGKRLSARSSITLQPFTRIAISPTIGWERFEDAGDTLYDGLVTRLKLELFATPTLWNRWIYDQSTFSGRRSLESLVAWERAPGQAFYFGGRYARGGLDDDDVVQPSMEPEWALFTKISWVFRR